MGFTNKGLPMLVVIVFVAALLSPIILNFTGSGAEVPKPELPKIEKECVEPAAWMRANHMQLLDDWRNEVVRDSERTYESNFKPKDDLKGKATYDKSLSRTCMKCHDNKKNFCDRCHTYASVRPYCWTCHVVPEEKI